MALTSPDWRLRRSGIIRAKPLMYSQFCHYILQDERVRRATMHINRKPGEQIEVDWAGDPAYIIDSETGEQKKAYVFVGVLNYSRYAYAEAFLDEKQKSWNDAHIHMFELLEFFILCGSLRTACSKYTPEGVLLSRPCKLTYN